MSGFHARTHGDFIANTIHGISSAMERVFYADYAGTNDGLLQQIDPRVKLAGMVVLIVSVNAVTKPEIVLAVLLTAIILALLSRISLRRAMLPLWISTLVFSGAIALPAVFLTSGEPLLRLPGLNWNITAQGLRTATMLILRVETCSTLAMLLTFSTPWTYVLKSLRVFRIPVVFVAILGMTFRYILLLMDAAHEMFESRKSRTVGRLDRGEHRRLALAVSGVLLTNSIQLSSDVFLAMQARGYRGEVYILDEFEMSARDWVALATVTVSAFVVIWIGC